MKKPLIFILFIFVLVLAADLIYAQPNPKWITNITMSPSAPVPGAVVNFSATFRNAREPINNLRVVAGIDGTNIFDQKYPSLAKGQDTVAIFKWTALAGSHKAFFKIDPDGVSPDLYPGDNLLEMSFKIEGSAPPPTVQNLTITNVTYSPAYFVSGRKVKFNWTMKNTGNSTIQSALTCFQTDDHQHDYCAIRSFAPGFSYDYTWTWEVKCGATITIIADPKNQIIESNESDNSRVKKIKCSLEAIRKKIE